jgi:hypothetical protein
MVVHGKLPDESPTVYGMYQDWKKYKEYMEGKKDEYKDTTRHNILNGTHQFSDGYYIETTLVSIYEIANMKNVPYICELVNEITRSDAISKLTYLSESNWNYVLLEYVFMIVRYGNRDMNNDTIEEAKVKFKNILGGSAWRKITDIEQKKTINANIDAAAEDIKKWNNLLDLKDIIEPIRKDTQKRLEEANDGEKINSSEDMKFEQVGDSTYLKCGAIRCLKYRARSTLGYYIGEYIGEPTANDSVAMGSVRWVDGDIMEGEWKNGKLNGKGYSLSDGSIKIGTFIDGELHGTNCYQISAITRDNITIQRGNFERGRLKAGDAGNMTERYSKGRFYEVLFSENARDALYAQGKIDIGCLRRYAECKYYGKNPIDCTMEYNSNGEIKKIVDEAGNIYEGKFKDNFLQNGTIVKNGTTLAVGEFEYGFLKNGSKNYSDGSTSEGEFVGDELIDGVRTDQFGALYEGKFQNSLLNGEECKSITSSGVLTIGTYSNGNLDQSKPFYQVMMLTLGDIELNYKSLDMQGTETMQTTEIFNWLYTDSNSKVDVDKDIKQYIKDHIAWVIYRGNPKAKGIQENGTVSGLGINVTTYTGELKDYLLNGPGRISCSFGFIAEGEFEYGFLTQGVRVEPKGEGYYSIDIFKRESDSKKITKFYHGFGEYNTALEDLENEIKGLATAEHSNEQQEKLKFLEKAKKILAEAKTKREAANIK